MAKRVLNVGQCGPDHWAIESFLRRNFDCELDQSDGTDDTLAMLRSGSYDLVLVNRKLDVDYSDGIDVIRALKADPAVAAVPVMLITNYPEHQEEAIAAGAIRGFGKLEMGKAETVERLAKFLAT